MTWTGFSCHLTAHMNYAVNKYNMTVSCIMFVTYHVIYQSESMNQNVLLV